MLVVLRAHHIVGWRRNYPLPGKPDLVFRGERVAVFLDGCFWHKCPQCFRQPTSNTEYWVPKIEGNVRRDRRVDRELRARGWRVLRVWEHSLREPEKVAARLKRALRAASPAGPSGERH